MCLRAQQHHEGGITSVDSIYFSQRRFSPIRLMFGSVPGEKATAFWTLITSAISSYSVCSFFFPFFSTALRRRSDSQANQPINGSKTSARSPRRLPRRANCNINNPELEKEKKRQTFIICIMKIIIVRLRFHHFIIKMGFQ